MNMLFRLKNVTREMLFLETVIYPKGDPEPLMRFWPGSSLKGNPSNWWTPNRSALKQMLLTAGFCGILPIAEKKNNRVLWRALRAEGSVNYSKLLPRAPHLMELAGGNR